MGLQWVPPEKDVQQHQDLPRLNCELSLIQFSIRSTFSFSQPNFTFTKKYKQTKSLTFLSPNRHVPGFFFIKTSIKTILKTNRYSLLRGFFNTHPTFQPTKGKPQPTKGREPNAPKTSLQGTCPSTWSRGIVSRPNLSGPCRRLTVKQGCGNSHLVGGWTTHLKNMSQMGDHLPRDRGENKKIFELPPSSHGWFDLLGNYQETKTFLGSTLLKY